MSPLGSTSRRVGGLFATAIAFAAIALTPTASDATAVARSAPGTQLDQPAQLDQPEGSRPRIVTLVSGDRVTVHGGKRFTVAPRRGVRFLSYTARGHQYVIPTDALPLLRADRLDRRLFDVTALLDAGYDRRADLGLIVSSGSPPPGLRVTRRLAAARGYSGKVSKAKLPTYWTTLTTSSPAAGPGKVWLDGVRRPSLDVSVPQIGAPSAWAGGFDGTGVRVAVLDSGIDASHPDLAGKVVAARNFASEVEDALDRVGHGTHVASTIAGSGAASGGRYKGVSPGARLLDGKVCATYGCEESWIIAGMQWAAESGAKVVNMSLGGPDTPGVDPMEQAVNDLSAQYGTLFVIAAGNEGPGEMTVGSPASADAALAVGAVSKSDELAEFSGRGPRVGDAALKPEITAPGVEIVAANSKDGKLGGPGEAYTTLSGTSMATPHVAGAAAILAQRHPGWAGGQVKAALMAAARPHPDSAIDAQGAGRVDVARAIGQTVTTTPAAVSFGRQEWPHDDDPRLTRTVTYRNDGTSPVTLALALNTSAPAGTFVLSSPTITVPAAAEASVTITADTRHGDQLGYLGGHVTATAGGLRVQTPFAVERETEKYGLRLEHTDRSGAPATSYMTLVFNTLTGQDYVVADPDAVAELRLPRGPYLVATWINSDGATASTSLLTWPNLELAANETVRLDARQAKGFDVTVPDKTVTPVFVGLSGELRVDNAHWFAPTVFVIADRFGAIYSRHLGPRAVDGFSSQLSATLARPGPAGAFDNSSVSYDLAWHQQGAFFTGHTRHLRAKDLATVKTSYARHSLGLAWRTRTAVEPGSTIAWGASLLFALPASHTEYVTVETAWKTSFEEVILGEDGKPYGQRQLLSALTTYRPGRTYAERWNNAVVGPTMPAPDTAWSYLGREGDEITISPPLLGDAAGRFGNGSYTTARTALYRNGELIEETPDPVGFFHVPAEPGRYRIESSLQRDARLSNNVSVTWQFDSRHVDGVQRLPLTAIGFAPTLDDHNTARRGTVMVIPVSLRQQPDSGAAPISKLTVEVSHDDGATWTNARVVRVGGLRLLVLHNPTQPGFVSLRAHAEDTAGNVVDQTVIRAYEVAGKTGQRRR